MNRLLFIDTGDTGKTRPILTTRPAQHPVRGARLRYSTVKAASYSYCYYNPVVLLPSLPSLPFHRLLGSPGLAKPPPDSTALPGVPKRLGTLL